MQFDDRDPGVDTPPDCAAVWVVRAHLRELTHEEQRALRGWLALSPANGRAYLKTEVIWRLAGGLLPRRSQGPFPRG